MLSEWHAVLNIRQLQLCTQISTTAMHHQ